MENQPEEVTVDIIEKGLRFKQYPSLQLHTRDKFINHVRQLGYDAKDIVWVASEKIHGSNFSIHYNGEQAKYGRRTDFLTKDIPVPCDNLQTYFNQAFYDAKKLVSRFHNKLQDIYETIREYEPKLLKYAIYGEYFGGFWPVDHPNYIKIKPKAVQQGISYSPNHEFVAFDVFIVSSDRVYWADVFDIPKLLKDNIRTVPVYTKGTFDQVFNVDIKIDSTIPEFLGLPKLQKNLIEGMVVRPNISINTKEGARIVIKKKNAEFLQIVNVPNPAKKEKKEKAVDPALSPFLDELTKYLNVNRIDSVVSKYPDLKDRNKLREEVTKDILSDAQKDQLKLPAANEELYKNLIKQFNALVFKQINNYFIKH